jgi:leucine dehydrogenase
MSVFSHRSFDDHQSVHFHADPDCGLKAIIAIHNTKRGPAVGGCRMWPYGDDDAALSDVLRLSRGMTLKSALAEMPFGGGKAIIIGDPARDKSPALWRAMGRFVESLGGRYVIAEDVGTSPADMEIVRCETRHVAGIEEGGSGDPSPATAWGVFKGIGAALETRFGHGDLSGVRVAVQGLGHVGLALCELLAQAGAVLIVADLDDALVARAGRDYGATPVAADAIYDQAVDVFAPCAMGAILNDQTIARLKAAIIAGAANNQLAENRHGAALMQAGIVYAPDYAINAGGIINISHEGPDYDRARAFAHVARIHGTLLTIFAHAADHGIATNEAAERIARDRIQAVN